MFLFNKHLVKIVLCTKIKYRWYTKKESMIKQVHINNYHTICIANISITRTFAMNQLAGKSPICFGQPLITKQLFIKWILSAAVFFDHVINLKFVSSFFITYILSP